MRTQRFWGHAVTALLAGVAGWWLNSAGSPPVHVGVVLRPVNAVSAPPAGTSPRLDETPLIAVSSYGTVTLRVEQQPLDWVLEEIARQSGWADVKERAAARSRPVRTPLPSIESRSEPDRYASLVQARSGRVPIAAETLKRLYEKDTSERVRLLALEAYLAPLANDPQAQLAALEAALQVPDDILHSVVNERLESLLNGEGPDGNAASSN